MFCFFLFLLFQFLFLVVPNVTELLHGAAPLLAERLSVGSAGGERLFVLLAGRDLHLGHPAAQAPQPLDQEADVLWLLPHWCRLRTGGPGRELRLVQVWVDRGPPPVSRVGGPRVCLVLPLGQDPGCPVNIVVPVDDLPLLKLTREPGAPALPAGPVVVLVHTGLVGHPLHLVKLVGGDVVRQGGQVLRYPTQRNQAGTFLHGLQLLRRQLGLVKTNKRLLPQILVSPVESSLLSPERWEIHLVSTSSLAIKTQLSLALRLAKTVDGPDPVEATVPLPHLVEDDLMSDLIYLSYLHFAAGNILVGVPIPVLSVGPGRHLHLLPVLQDPVPVDCRHRPPSNLHTSNKPCGVRLAADVVKPLPEDWRKLFLPDDQITIALHGPELVGGHQGVLPHVVFPRVPEDQGAHLAGVMNLGLLKPSLTWNVIRAYHITIEIFLPFKYFFWLTASEQTFSNFIGEFQLV